MMMMTKVHYYCAAAVLVSMPLSTTLAFTPPMMTPKALLSSATRTTTTTTTTALFGLFSNMRSQKKARGEGYGMPLDNISEAVGNTPLVKINRLLPDDVADDITLYAKCEYFNPLSSVKDRLALSIIETAEKEGKLKPGDTVVEATSGNTGIAVAMMCAQRGYKVCMYDELSF